MGLLFTPRLYCFKGRSGVDFVAAEDMGGIYSLYADIMYCAALNLWTLEGKDEEDAPFTRADFHEFMVVNPKAYGKAFSFAFEAMTGKSLKDVIAEQEKGEETKKNDESGIKKKTTHWITRLLKSF